MASSNLVQPPTFSQLWWLVLWRSFELTLLIMGIALCSTWWWLITLWPGEALPLELAPIEIVLSLAAGPACLFAAWMLRRRGRRAAPTGFRRVLLAEPAVALVELPSSLPLATISRLPWMARLMEARLEFASDAIAIKWRFGERRFAHREIVRAEWQHDGVLVLLRDGQSLLIPTSRPPLVTGPSQYPEIGQAVQAATFAVLRHNQDIAERIRWECERVGGPGYRRAARSND